MIEEKSPLTWLQYVATALQWPVVVAAAFWAGKYAQKLEHRVRESEGHLKALVERHMPSIHRALAEIRGMLQGNGD